MKILLLGDASNYHNSLAYGLKSYGHTVCVASAGSGWMKTQRDIDLSRHLPGKIGGALLYARFLTTLAPKLRGYDIVQLVSPSFVQLRPKRLYNILKKLKHNNGAIWLSALGTDSNFVRALTSPEAPLGYSEWHTPDGLTKWSASQEAHLDQWLAHDLTEYTDILYSTIDGAVTALYEYHKVLEHTHPDLKLAYGGIPICIDRLPNPKFTANKPLKILYAAHRGREGEKGSFQLLTLLHRLQYEFPDKIALLEPPNIPYDSFINLLRQVDIVSDQLYSYTPGTTALLAMALGAATISGGEEEYYKFINEKYLRPIINPDPFNLEKTYYRLRELILKPDELMHLRHQGRLLVERHNDARLVASRFINAWNSSANRRILNGEVDFDKMQ